MSRRVYAAIKSPQGPISPKIDESTGLSLLQLPDGFRYMSFSWTGDRLRGGVLCPNLHDGMAVVDERGNSGKVILARHHLRHYRSVGRRAAVSHKAQSV